MGEISAKKNVVFCAKGSDWNGSNLELVSETTNLKGKSCSINKRFNGKMILCPNKWASKFNNHWNFITPKSVMVNSMKEDTFKTTESCSFQLNCRYVNIYSVSNLNYNNTNEWNKKNYYQFEMTEQRKNAQLTKSNRTTTRKHIASVRDRSIWTEGAH